MNNFDNVNGFDWDKHNSEKIYRKYKITIKEAENIFADSKFVLSGVRISGNETRYATMGTSGKKKLIAIFTIRKNKIRIISARPQSERREKSMKKNQKTNNLKNIPAFKSEAEELNFCSKNDTSGYFEFNSINTAAFPNLKYSTESISIRLPKSLLDNVKSIANKKDVPYQSLIKVYLSDKVNEELNKYL